jgi:hypothetical protein
VQLRAIDDREEQVGRANPVVVDAVDRRLVVLLSRLADDVAAGVAVTAEARKVAAGCFEPDAVSGQKYVRGDPHRSRWIS